MAADPPIAVDPTLDLVFDRIAPLPPARIWRAWTEPGLLKQWFCPEPWSVSECVIDLRPGGRFFTMMRSPDDQPHPNEGCYLDVVPGRRLVFTDALTAGYRPAGKAFATITIDLTPHADGTRYLATVLHPDAATRQKHLDMGFEQGWGTALEQLIALMRP